LYRIINSNLYKMDHKEKIFALIGLVGKAKVAYYLGMTAPTFASRLGNPGDWKLREIETIDKMYNYYFSNEDKK
jgi:hypothetical protein